jgi:aspartate/methionine/tyrosine aminotransferase
VHILTVCGPSPRFDSFLDIINSLEGITKPHFDMHYQRMAIEKEAPEEVGTSIKYNLSESAISDQTLQSLGIEIPTDLILTYTEHKGSHRIRSIVARAAGGPDVDAEDVLVTAGASISLFVVNTALLGPNDHIVVTRPNYATNLEVPRSIGCEISFVDLEFESQYRVDVANIAAAIRPGKTKLISLCSPNNPTGTMHTAAELRAIAVLAKRENCYLLVDETYADLRDANELAADTELIPCAATLGDHVISVCSMSKAYGVPGIRIGWLITTNPSLQESFLAAKEQISISGSVLDEVIAEQILARKDELLPATVADLRRRRDLVAAWVQREDEWIEWVRPTAGAMGFIHVKRTPAIGMDRFYAKLLEEYGVYIGRGGWFEQDDTFFRLGYGWPTVQELEEGLGKISEVLRAS